MSMRTLHEKIGFIPQSAFLFSGTVADNLRMGKPDATEEEMWEALETAQAADLSEPCPTDSTASSRKTARIFPAVSASASR